HLFRLLYDLEPARFSSLVYLGLDLVAAAPWNEKQLLGKLVSESEHWGARFEVEVWAAFHRAGVVCEYEPFRSRGSKNPDFRVEICDGLVIDVKFSDRSARNRQDDDFFEAIAGRFDLQLIHISRDIRFTQALHEALGQPARRGEILRRQT